MMKTVEFTDRELEVIERALNEELLHGENFGWTETGESYDYVLKSALEKVRKM